MTTSPLDFLVLAAYLVAVVAFGLWVGREQKGAADYMIGDRDIAWWGLLFSIVATETSTVTFLSVPGLAFDPEHVSLDEFERIRERFLRLTDARLIEAVNLQIEEAPLTGESLPVDAGAGALVYAGVIVRRGEATGCRGRRWR